MKFGESGGALLCDRDFQAVWFVGILTGIVRWLEFLAFGIYAYDLTGSPILVALLALLRFLPLVLFGVFIGALADLADPRRLLYIGYSFAGSSSWAEGLSLRFNVDNLFDEEPSEFRTNTLNYSEYTFTLGRIYKFGLSYAF